MQLYIGYTSGRNFDVCIVMTLNASCTLNGACHLTARLGMSANKEGMSTLS